MKPLRTILLAIAALTMMAASSDSARFEKLGHALMCTCGCNQVLLECNHVGCPSSDGMIKQLHAGLDAGQTDPQVMDSFVAQYGAVVLAAPTMQGFDRVAWITPFAVFILGMLLAAGLVRYWYKKRVPAVAAAPGSGPQLEALKARIREETSE